MANNSRSSGAPVADEKGSSLVLPTTRLLLTLITAAGLAVDAYVHWDLAPLFDPNTGTGSPQISQGQLFRLEAGMALIAMLLVLTTRRRIAALIAFLVSAGGLAAVVLFAYVDLSGLGPLPDMYDPVWYTEKTWSAVAEGVAALAALGLFLLPRR